MKTFEDEYHIWVISEVLEFFDQVYPNAKLTGLKLAYKGPFMRYKISCQDGSFGYVLEINAQTGGVLREKRKILSPVEIRDVEQRVVNTEQLLSLHDINEIAKANAPTLKSYQWEMRRQGERTIWKVQLADEHGNGNNITIVKVDAQDGTVLQVKCK